MKSDAKRAGMPRIPSARRDDLINYEIREKADLVLYLAGNQFIAMPSLLAAFQQIHPEVKNIFCETLPPGLELKQILAGGAIFEDTDAGQDVIISGRPDVYSSVSKEGMDALAQVDLIDPAAPFVYLHNKIVLMVPEDNPANISKVEDLGRGEVRISQPNPEVEDIGHYIVDMYREAGGEELVRRIMEEKRAEGTTILTIVHHRETPLRMKLGTVDVGPVWATEVTHALQEGLKVALVEPGEGLDQKDKVNYYITLMKDPPNPENGEKFIAFIRSERASEIYRSFGFIPHF